MTEKEVVIIGGGPGGYVAAVRAAQLGVKVTLVEEDALGGTCLNRGCIPTKALLRGAELLKLLEESKDFGIQTGIVSVDFAKMITRKDRAVKDLVSGVGNLLKSNGVEVIKGKATLLSPNKIEVADEKGRKTLWEARKVILATGSVSAAIPIPGNDLPGVIDSDGALRLTEIPKEMVVIGAGPIGLEFGTIFGVFGTKVTVLEMMPQILPTEDPEVASVLNKSLRHFKIETFTEAQVKSISQDSGKLRVTAETKEGKKVLKGDKVLVAVGRRPNVNGLGLEAAGVRSGKKGIEVNDKMETNVEGVYAIGDVTGKWPLAHFASAQGVVAAENVAGDETTMDSRIVPRCVYTLPEVASVGLTEKEAKEAGHELKIGRFPFSLNGKAMILGERDGFIKIISEAKYDEILGVHMVGPHTTDLIGEVVVAMRLEGTALDVARAIHPHPTLTEAVMESALDVHGMAVHIPPRKKT